MSLCEDKYEQQLYDDIFNDEYEMMMNLMKTNKYLHHDIENYLRMAYITCDDNWIGSGRYDDVINNARIAAMELIRSILIQDTSFS